MALGRGLVSICFNGSLALNPKSCNVPIYIYMFIFCLINIFCVCIYKKCIHMYMHM